ncbi:MAG: LamG-like jellyroll fold domain-containing protein [Isosphaeraceae bacterium]
MAHLDHPATPRPACRLRRVLPLGILILFGSAPSPAAEGDAQVKPFLAKYCLRCHNGEKRTSGVSVEPLGPVVEERHQKLWEAVRKQVAGEAMPPEDEPQPDEAERKAIDDWIRQALAVARSRPTPKNGGARRLTVAQYRNTLRELLHVDDDLADVLPPDAVSRDGFVNNRETLALSPLLIEAYFDVAEKALDSALVEPSSKPTVQFFRVDLGENINRDPCPDRLILGANSLLLDNRDFTVTEPRLEKPFDFVPFKMRTRYRFIEGYAGNDTVRGWRDYDTISHSVFACMRGSPGYPKGLAYETVPDGLLLRPAITNDELFDQEGTYGPKANFKISLRELPDRGRFRVTVTASKYPDGLLLDPGAARQPADASGAVVCDDPESPRTVKLARAGVYQVDVDTAGSEQAPPTADPSRLTEGLAGFWPLDGDAKGRAGGAGRLVADAKFVRSPFGQAIALDGDGDAVEVSRSEDMKVGKGDFTVSAWVRPQRLGQSGVVSRGKYGWTHGWILDTPDDEGTLRLETAGPDNQPNGTVKSPPKTLRANEWQHVAAVVRRAPGESKLYVNGFTVAGGTVHPADLDNPKLDLQIGRIAGDFAFQGQVDEVRLYRRALGEAEIQALVEPGRKFARRPGSDTPQTVALTLGGRRFTGAWRQPAFLVLRLPAGDLPVQARRDGPARLGRITFTPLDETGDLARRFAAFERRVPRLGVHLGLRRDCGSTLAPVGDPQPVTGETPGRFVFEGAIRNFPSPDVEPDNVNYLAGVREIGVRSEYTDGRDMPRLLIHSVEFEGPYYDAWPPASHRSVFAGSEQKPGTPTYAHEVIQKFAARAFRRPVTAEESAALTGVFDRSLQTGSTFPKRGRRTHFRSCSRRHSFCSWSRTAASPAAEPLDDFELARSLPYFLWNGPPDRRTLDLAASGSGGRRRGSSGWSPTQGFRGRSTSSLPSGCWRSSRCSSPTRPVMFDARRPGSPGRSPCGSSSTCSAGAPVRPDRGRLRRRQ